MGLQNATNMFFNEWFWLPPHLTWEDMANTPDNPTMYKAQPGDLWLMFPAAAVLFIFRLLFERFVALPIGNVFGLSSTVTKATSNPVLEAAYLSNPWPNRKEIQSLIKQTDLSEMSIQRWLRKRRNQDKATNMTRFKETLWRWFFYFVIFYYGLYTVSQKSWFYDVKDCWRGYPHQHVTSDLYAYYVIELAFYLSLLFSQFADVKRKDFWEQCIHHVVTILLMSFSWSMNFVRIGALILCLHDACDYFLEGAKAAKYLGWKTFCEVQFVMFTVLWAITRLMIFPYVILWTTGVDAFEIAGSTPCLIMLNVLLWTLQVLHVFWFVLIMRVVLSALTTGEIERDIRSDNEESGEELSPPNGTKRHN